MCAEPNRTIGVAVLGAAATIAPAIVRDLAESREVDRLLLLDLDGDRAAAVASEHGGGKATAQAIDARAEGELASRLGDLDVLVNTASYRINLEAMRACLSANSHYLDLGGLYWMTGRQLELSSRFQDAGLLAVLGIGSSPGKTNLMALRALQELGDQAGEIDSIEVAAAGRDPRATDDAGPRPAPPRRRPTAPALRDPDAARRADAGPDRAARRPPDRDPAPAAGRRDRLRRSDRHGRDDLHAALRARHLR